MLSALLREFRRLDLINRRVFQPFKTQLLFYAPEDLTYRSSTFCTQSACVLCTDVRTQSGQSPYIALIDLCDRVEACLLRGMNYIILYTIQYYIITYHIVEYQSSKQIRTPVRQDALRMTTISVQFIYHLRLGLPSGLLPSGVPNKAQYAFLLHFIDVTCNVSIVIDFIISITFCEVHTS